MTTFSTNATCHVVKARPSSALQRLSLHRLRALWRSRRALAALTPAQLDDIGLSERAAAKEADRPVWDVPAHWLD